MNFSPSLSVLALYFVWLAILTFAVFQFYMGYMRLAKKGKKESIAQVLDEVLKHEENNKKTLDLLQSGYDKLNREGSSHIQKIGLVRFNPFKDTGGDQSFILALVDAENTGVVISSLHTRTGTRWYAKTVVSGKGVEYELSDDEEKALKGAQFLSAAQK